MADGFQLALAGPVTINFDPDRQVTIVELSETQLRSLSYHSRKTLLEFERQRRIENRRLMRFGDKP